MADKNLFYCYSNRLNTFLGLFGFQYIDKGNNQKGQEYKSYQRTENLNFVLQHWKVLNEKFSVEEIKRKHN